MGWIYDLIIYAILFLIFAVRKEKGKRISLLISVIFASISCLTYLESNRLMLIPHIAIGIVAVVLMYFVEKKHPKVFKKPRKKITAGLLGLLLGSFGSHGFYLGHWAWACFYLLFWWTYIPALLGMVEGILIFILPKQLFEKFYCQPWILKKSILKVKKSSTREPSPTTKHQEARKVEFETQQESEASSDLIEYSNISLHETKTLKTASAKGNIEKFTITIDTEIGPVHFLVENGNITSHYLESKKKFKQYEVN